MAQTLVFLAGSTRVHDQQQEQVEAEIEAAEAANPAGGGGDDAEDEDGDASLKTGFQEPPFTFEYGFNPLVALGDFIRAKHPRRRLKLALNCTRAFRVRRSEGVRPVTFVAPGPCCAEATVAACQASLAACQAEAAAASSVLEEVGGGGASYEDRERARLADLALCVAETVCAPANQMAASGHVAGASTEDLQRLFDPRLGAAGAAHAAAAARALAQDFSAAEARRAAAGGGGSSLEAQRRALRAASGQEPSGPFDLVATAPLTACLATTARLLADLPGDAKKVPVVVAPVLTATAVVTKGLHLDPAQKREATLPSRKGRSAAELAAEFHPGPGSPAWAGVEGEASAAEAAAAAQGAPPNAFGLCVGKSASKEYFAFAAVFEPYCEETKAAEKLLEEGFKLADPNGNGLCSLAECEAFLLKTLVAQYRAGPGEDTWDAFRPAYIRAFADAKDFARGGERRIAGTKDAVQDDFVLRSEFRLFCVYAVIYAAMFDAFAKVDGGGSGRGSHDDKRIVRDEWLRGYKGVLDHGFAALAGITDKESAAAAFAKMDVNGGGIVLLAEWCAFIKAGEVAAGTPVGKLLSLEEPDAVAAPAAPAPAAAAKGHPQTPGAGLASQGWDFSALSDEKQWRTSSNPVARPGHFHPLRLEGSRCEEGVEWLCGRVERRVLCVAQAEALTKILGVPQSLFAASPGSGGSDAGPANAGAAAGGLVRRLVGAEFTSAVPFTLPGGRQGESSLVKALLEGELGAFLAAARGFVGFALHFEHAEAGGKSGGGLLATDEADDSPLRLTDAELAAAAAAALEAGTASDGYESYGGAKPVKSVLHLHWANLGHADECCRIGAVVDGVNALLAPFTADPKLATPDDKAAEARAALRAQAGNSAKGRYTARVDKWPLSLPGTGPAQFSAHAAQCGRKKPPPAAWPGTGGKAAAGPGGGPARSGARGSAASYIRLKFRTEAHSVQGKRLYREKILEPCSCTPGFVQAWFELEEGSGDGPAGLLACRVTLLYRSAEDRDAAFDDANGEYAGSLAPLSRAGSLTVAKGRTVGPDALPDPANRGFTE